MTILQTSTTDLRTIQAAEKLTAYLRSKYGLGSHAIRNILHYSRYIHVEKSTLLPVDTTGGSIYFICEGVVRTFQAVENGCEINIAFDRGPCQVCSIDAIFKQHENASLVSAITRTFGFSISSPNLKLLADCDTSIERMWCIFLEDSIRRLKKRELSLLTQSAEERLDEFSISFPELFDCIPLYHVASYLGMNPVTLSRIRRKSKLYSSQKR